MDGILSEDAAENGIGAFRLDTSDGVAQIEVFDRDFHIIFLAVRRDAVFEQESDIFFEDVSRGVTDLPRRIIKSL